MIFLFTGLPGHGKTLNAIKFALEDFKDRDIYHNDIPGLTLDWKKHDPKKWHELPSGSVMVIDEAQRVFPVRKQGSAVPPHVEQLETNRHQGHDLIIITQHPKLIDVHLRKLVDTHFHFLRQFGSKTLTRYHKTGCWEPTSTTEKASCIKKTVRLDSKIFGLYKSAEVHTVKRRIPMVIFLPVIFLIISALAAWLFIDGYREKAGPVDPGASDGSPSQMAESNGVAGQVLQPGQQPTLTLEQYVQAHEPRLKGLAFTAPVYDQLRTVTQYPWPNCVSSRLRGCRCYTQQATHLDVSQSLCHQIIQRGLFDNARSSDREDSGTESPGADLVAVHLRAAEIYESMREPEVQEKTNRGTWK